jgi:hypothetical protein
MYERREYAYKDMLQKLEGKWPIRRPVRRQKDLKEIEWQGFD